ncbi:MAG: flavin reductase family protein [bacterium]
MTGEENIFKALSCFTYGIYIVSSRDGDKLNGQVVNTAFQLTAKPPRVAVSIHRDNLTHSLIKKSGLFSVSVLDENTPMTFIGLFGFKSGRDTDKFSGTSCKTGVTGCPMVTDNSLAIVEARVTQSLDIGTHTLFIGEIAGAEIIKDGTPLTYSFYREKKRGKTPKNATTYNKPE